MKILLSIKPEFVEKIFNGEKRYEFRKQIPKENVEKVFIYESAPTQSIVGWFLINKTISGHPDYIWERCKQDGGIDKKRFYSYCGMRNTIHAFEIGEIHKYEQPINPYHNTDNFVPPQNYMYLQSSDRFDDLPPTHSHTAQPSLYSVPALAIMPRV
jgi:predicted transcriptional regulator